MLIRLKPYLVGCALSSLVSSFVLLPGHVQMLLTKEEEAVKTALWLAEHADYLKEAGEPSLHPPLSLTSHCSGEDPCMDPSPSLLAV